MVDKSFRRLEERNEWPGYSRQKRLKLLALLCFETLLLFGFIVLFGYAVDSLAVELLGIICGLLELTLILQLGLIPRGAIYRTLWIMPVFALALMYVGWSG
jgi:hypothetical protein